MGRFFGLGNEITAGGASGVRGFFGGRPTVAVAPPVIVTTEFSLRDGVNSNGPYNVDPNNTYISASSVDAGVAPTPSGSQAGDFTPGVVLVNGQLLIVFGMLQTGAGAGLQNYLTVCLSGTPIPQDVFIKWTTPDDGHGNALSFTSASALYNSPWDETGSLYTTWQWLYDSFPFSRPMPSWPAPVTFSWFA